MFISFFDSCYHVYKSAYSRELFRAVNTHSGVAELRKIQVELGLGVWLG